MRLKDIPRFPHASYQVNVGWTNIHTFFNNCEFINLDPDYQRGYVWSQYQKERYIEYRLKGGFSGKDIFFNCPNWMMSGESKEQTQWHETMELVDGKQRIKTVQEFLDNRVKAFGKYLNEYEDSDAIRLYRYDFLFHVNNLKTKREVIEWYLGMNAGGSIHTEEDIQVAKNLLLKETK